MLYSLMDTIHSYQIKIFRKQKLIQTWTLFTSMEEYVFIENQYQNVQKYTNIFTLEQLIIENQSNQLNKQKLTLSGAQLRVLPNEIFNKDFETNVLERYNKYMKEQQTTELTFEIDQILKYNFKIYFAHAQYVHDKQMKHNSHIQELSLKISAQCKQVQKLIQTQIQIIKIMADKADLLFICQNDQ
ncbi:Hypothetical_protein [Hexamita inflata]|uniref:Hypothetical_protein n=1 Tax=Hexamita inflata TaxID=28002 RepID=A0AA86TYQ0_9EUKA|nr:Hypothetical protein HINF_LOCUS21061 [Hexamita inflata]